MKNICLTPLVLGILMACSKDPIVNDSCPGVMIISEFVNTDGLTIRIYEDGNAYFVNEGECTFAATYYDTGFYEETYNRTDSGVYIFVDANTYLAPIRTASLDFEGFGDAIDLIRTEIDQTELFLTNFTLQSPSAPTVDEYVDLQNCILNGTCDFIDNRFDLVEDPMNASNTVMKFYSVPPTQNMVTSKTSVTTTLSYFEQADDFWFEAKYFIEDNLPTTLADFESSYFLESPGPRIIIRGDKLAIENKFGEKLTFNQPEGTSQSFPLNQWVTVKVHLKYDEINGVVQLWQDGVLLINETGPNLPLDISIQNRVELGITATQKECTLYLDDVRFSDEEF